MSAARANVVKPRLSRSDLAESKRKVELAAIVHQAAVIAVSYHEAAHYIRTALAQHYGESDWCVAVTRSLYAHCRSRKGYAAIFALPCLLADLPANGNPLKAHAVTVMLWRCAGDATKVTGMAEMPMIVSPRAEASALPNIQAVAHSTSPTPEHAGQAGRVTAEPGEEATSSETPPLLVSPVAPTGYRQLSSTISSESATHAISRWAGGAQRREGLHVDSEGAFCKTLKEALSAQYGSTWHVLLGARFTPAAHAPAFAVTAAPSHTHEFVLSPLWPKGKEAAGRACVERTPAMYHVCVFRTLPGFGEPSPSSPSDWLPGWNGSLSGLWAMWRREPLTATRVVAYAAAAACLVSYVLLAHQNDNSCTRLAGFGFGTLPASLVGSGQALPIDPISGLEESHAGVSVAGSGEDIAGMAMGTGSFPWVNLRSVSSLWREVSSFMSLLGGAAFGLELRPWTNEGEAGLPAEYGVGHGGGSLVLDRRLPPLPDLPDGMGRSGMGMGLAEDITGGNALAAALGLASTCTRTAILEADRRMLRSRALMYACLALGTVAVLMRRVQVAREAAAMKASLHQLLAMLPANGGTGAGVGPGGGARTQVASGKGKGGPKAS